MWLFTEKLKVVLLMYLTISCWLAALERFKNILNDHGDDVKGNVSVSSIA